MFAGSDPTPGRAFYAGPSRHFVTDSVHQNAEVPPANIALVYVGLNENERALDWLERAYREGWRHVIYLNMNPFYEPLRGHPRFERLLRQIGLDS